MYHVLQPTVLRIVILSLHVLKRTQFSFLFLADWTLLIIRWLIIKYVWCYYFDYVSKYAIQFFVTAMYL